MSHPLLKEVIKLLISLLELNETTEKSLVIRGSRRDPDEKSRRDPPSESCRKLVHRISNPTLYPVDICAQSVVVKGVTF